MARLTAVYQWLKAHKLLAAKVVLFISGGLEALGVRELSAPLAALAFWLDGAGRARSDNEVKANQ